ncbi:hypothetical protein SynBIOSU31_02310 [Synechococcus sp. BIOS-U3-1]|nr:hypothetical protein SynBIOSU31_02310 [Synechococcus sp. BIOS-U3-1]
MCARPDQLVDRLQAADSLGCITGGELRRPDLEDPSAVSDAIDPLLAVG